MAVSGRINVDALFHDTDGTTSLKVVSLQSADSYTSGTVAVASGTCGTAYKSVSFSLGGIYKDAAGNDVTLASGISRIAFAANPIGFLAGENNEAIVSRLSGVAVTGTVDPGSNQTFFVRTTAGTASYTLVAYGD